ncbi:MAG TPA: RNA polymerase sigma factor [Clostridia bacterium]|jgi:RNA polymerase sigma-70 factor (ECF subfamily)|nr:RNA polymerase sigma factor [Clostridia bacterium]
MKRIIQLYELHKEAIFRYFLRMIGNEEEAGELTQEVFFQACLSLYRFKQESSLKTWLFSIARNVYLKHLRKKGVYKTQTWEENLHFSEQEPQNSDPAEILILKEERARIKKALALLPEKDRTIIILKEYEQLSYEEIARIYGQTVNWARVTFFRAKKRLGQVYREREDDHK